ncbi:MAG: prepilin-type N-terminal cleavage/methylation domain-containing protein [Cellvibrionaceae bacterium]|nr:prepilin-type N-terminal cleavage/methylation domain-containing protein [Cellvibrionaceae bacterium]
MASQKGFTLVELVAVIVIVAVLASMGSGYIANMMEGHRDTQQRLDLFSRARLSLNIISRHLQHALPNSVRLSSDGNCVAFLPVVGAGLLAQALADNDNQAAPSNRLELLDYQIDRGQAHYVVAGGVDQSEIYSGAALAPLASPSSGGANPVVLARAMQFVRVANNRRLFFVGQPQAICRYQGALYHYANIGSPSASGFSPSAPGDLIDPKVDMVGGGFRLYNQPHNRAAQIALEFNFQAGRMQLVGSDTVVIRNVP